MRLVLRPRFLLTLAATLAVSAAASAALADAVFSDPAGDASGAPDITSVEVTEPANGTFRFAVGLANAASLPATWVVGINFDLDRNSATGRNGEEAIASFLSVADGQVRQAELARWDGSSYVEVPGSGIAASVDGRGVTISVPRRTLGVSSFAFRVGSLTLDSFGRDWAPDAPPSFTYDAVTRPPPPVVLSTSKPIGTPATPVSGRPFTVSVQVRRSDTGAVVGSGAVECRARIPGKTVVLATGRFRSGRAGCAMRVPPGFGGSPLRGSITVRSLGSSATRTYVFRIRAAR